MTTVTCRCCGGVRTVPTGGVGIMFWFCHRSPNGRRCWTVNKAESRVPEQVGDA